MVITAYEIIMLIIAVLGLSATFIGLIVKLIVELINAKK